MSKFLRRFSTFSSGNVWCTVHVAQNLSKAKAKRTQAQCCCKSCCQSCWVVRCSASMKNTADCLLRLAWYLVVHTLVNPIAMTDCMIEYKSITDRNTMDEELISQVEQQQNDDSSNNSAVKNRCDWNCVYDEVVWYLTTDGTCTYSSIPVFDFHFGAGECINLSSVISLMGTATSIRRGNNLHHNEKKCMEGWWA